MQTYSFEGTLTGLSSITHNGGQSYGVNQKLRREKFVQPCGRVEEVPTISGNGLRGLLRDRGMLHMCRQLGYGIAHDGKIVGLTLPAFHFLFSGGSLGAGGKALDIETARAIRRLIPLVSIFGGGMGNALLPGKLKVNKAIPICQETAHLLPARYLEGRTLQSCWDLTQEEMYTRKDDAKNVQMRSVMNEDTREFLETAEIAKQQRAGEVQTDTGQNTQMMYYIETFAAGTVFHWRLILDDPTDLEFEAFLTCLNEFAKLPFAGGKSGTGLGEVRMNLDGWHKIDSRLEVEQEGQMQRASGIAYCAHLQQEAVNIRVVLQAIQ